MSDESRERAGTSAPNSALRLFVTRRWLLRFVAGLLLATGCVLLGLWQLDRNEQRTARNAIVEANVDAAPVPIDDIIAPDAAVTETLEWRTVTVRGAYDPDRQLRLRLRPVDGERGVHALVPLVTADGTTILVNRGFVPGADDVPIPDPPAGTVTVTGRLRPAEGGSGLGGDVQDGAIRHVDTATLAEEWQTPMYQAWLRVSDESPPADQPLEPLPDPTTEAGPHLSYALQWFLFATIGVGGFVILIRAESKASAGRSAEPTRLRRNGTSD